MSKCLDCGKERTREEELMNCPLCFECVNKKANSSIYISNEKRVDLIVKTLSLNLSKEEHDYLVYELYRHIDHTRITAYANGYEQGKFDEKMNQLNA